MPLPAPRPPIVSAPRWAGVGLREELLLRWMLRPPPSWPESWWQRDYDDLWDELLPGPIPLTEREMRIPGFPYPPPL